MGAENEPPRRVPRRSFLWTAGGLAQLAGGCGSRGAGVDRAAVRGTVTVGGVPLEEGGIAFYPALGTTGPSSGGGIVNGRFDIPRARGPVVGTNRVEIRGSRETGRLVASPLGGTVEERIDVVSREFNQDSTLTVRIAAGDNQFTFEIPPVP